MKKILTFEISHEDEKLEIHINSLGAKYLINLLENMYRENKSNHNHLFSENWGGHELTTERQNLNPDFELIDGVKIIYWDKK